jgi:hypothetical protein
LEQQQEEEEYYENVILHDQAMKKACQELDNEEIVAQSESGGENLQPPTPVCQH